MYSESQHIILIVFKGMNDLAYPFINLVCHDLYLHLTGKKEEKALNVYKIIFFHE